ncbi:SRPBCC family protein [Streptomyces sp. I05A-00742]|uniref:SRPBCC family protein n=1 Tax=Streptomyces sp. I05A-00742 TaxID=2732853 RepID=UPI001489BB8E|nr:SRPBCC family protein [Streptomyces sp. I05A-00742]
MTESTQSKPLFQLSSEIFVDASPLEIYSIVSDLERTKEWSRECKRIEWVSGEPGTVGAIFRSENYRKDEVVAWAPVPRGAWMTQSEVVAAEPGKIFSWQMYNSDGVREDSVWAYDIEPEGDGSVLVHRFRMNRPTKGILRIVSGLNEADTQKFYEDWAVKLQGDIHATLGRIKAVIEKK